MDDNLKKFCKNYEVKIVNDNGRYARYHPPTFFAYEKDASLVRNDIVEYDTERLYTVQIPESSLNTLVEMEKRFYNWRGSSQPRDMFETLMDKEREEAHYRHTNSAVQKAYEQYSVLLNLAGYQRKF
jgi:hypothetical protein